MECLLGVQGRDFVILASDTSSNRSVVSMKQDTDKMFKLSSRVALVASGEAGDTVQFCEYIAKNIQLYKMINGYELSPHAATSFTRKQLADYLRSSSAYQVNLLIGGYDDETGPALYYMDYLASAVKLPFAMHGYGGFFGLSVMDRNYKEDLTRDEAIQLVGKVIKEVNKRFIVNLPSFKVRIIDKDGIKDLADIRGSSLA